MNVGFMFNNIEFNERIWKTAVVCVNTSFVKVFSSATSKPDLCFSVCIAITS